MGSPRAAEQQLIQIAALREELSDLRTSEHRRLVAEARWRHLMEHSPFAIVVWRPDGSVLEGSAAMARLFPMTPEERELVMANYSVLEDPKLEASPLGDAVRAAFAGEVRTLPTTEYEVETAIEGTPIKLWLEGAVFPIHDAAGELAEVVCIQFDATARMDAFENARASQRALVEQVSELEQLYANAPVGLALVDTDLRYVRINEMLAELNGVPREDHIGRTMREVIPWLADEAEPVFRRIIETGEPVLNSETRLATPSQPDVERDWLVSHYPLFAEDGTVRGVSTVVQEITAQKRAAAAQRESEARLAEVADNIREVFWLLDVKERKAIYLSPAYETVWGRSVEEGLPDVEAYARTIHPADRRMALESMEEIIATGVERDREYRIVRPDGEVRWVNDRTVLIRDDDGQVVRAAGFVEDITEQRAAAAERTRFEAKLRHAQKLESLGVLAGGIAHDFNNLLVGMLGNAELGAQRLESDSPAREYLEGIRAAALRAAELTNQLLAYSGQGHFVIEPVDLNDLVVELNHLLTTVISKKAEVLLDLAPDLPAIEADASQIRQVVMNLITNAAESLGDDAGRIVVRTHVAEMDAATRTACEPHEPLPAGPCVCLEVSDSGCGFDVATKEKLFDPFYTTKFTGRGLGLAAVLGIVRGHGAAIRVDSLVGSGSTFSLYFAPSGARATLGSDSVVSDGSADPSGATVLIVDDEPGIRMVACRMLEDVGFQVVTAADGEEALERLGGSGNGIDVVLLDLTMPRLDGEEVLLSLRERRIDVPVVLSSGYSEQAAADRFRNMGLAGFLQKPYTAMKLADTLRGALRRS